MEKQHNGWINCPIPEVDCRCLQLVLKGVDQSLRVRQVKVLGDTVFVPIKKSATQLQQLSCEAETLKVFRILTSHVCSWQEFLDCTVKLLNIRTPEKYSVVILKFDSYGFFYREMCPNDSDRMANSLDTDQTAPLVWVYIVCSDLPVRKFRNITVWYWSLSPILSTELSQNMQQKFGKWEKE